MRWICTGLLLTAVVAGGTAWASTLHASGVGADLIHNQVERLAHPDVPDSRDSTVLRRRVFGFWHHEWSEAERLQLDLEHEAYALEDDDGTALIDLSLARLHPRYRVTEPRWALDAALLVLDVGRNDARYARVPQDDRDTFVLPALVGDYTPRPALFRAGFWEEYEILTLTGSTYAVSLSRVIQLGAGYAFSPDAEAWLEGFATRRFYPDRYALERTDAVATYRLRDPLDAGEAPVWREASAALAQKHYPVTGQRFLELTLGSVLRLGGNGVAHFLVPELVLADSFVVYRPGALPDSLLETTVERNDATARLKYEGFTHLQGGPYVLAWGGTVDASLIRNVQRTLIVHVKLEHTY